MQPRLLVIREKVEFDEIPGGPEDGRQAVEDQAPIDLSRPWPYSGLMSGSAQDCNI
jgi:hypothetical protein